ncbi:hypothetical protein BN126_1119 [Cronobacter sakazakii 680]|nr:hypothetical protein BN126_1119 [Cronobacter sakazakii 680]
MLISEVRQRYASVSSDSSARAEVVQKSAAASGAKIKHPFMVFPEV